MDYAQYSEQFSKMSPAAQTVTGVVTFFVVALAIIAEWKIFNKAGIAGWHSLIPILREYDLCKLADGKGIKFLLFIIPGVNIIYAILYNFRLASSFGKGTGFAIGLIFFPNIFQLVLGFGSSKYIGPRGEQRPLNYR